MRLRARLTRSAGNGALPRTPELEGYSPSPDFREHRRKKAVKGLAAVGGGPLGCTLDCRFQLCIKTASDGDIPLSRSPAQDRAGAEGVG